MKLVNQIDTWGSVIMREQPLLEGSALEKILDRPGTVRLVGPANRGLQRGRTFKRKISCYPALRTREALIDALRSRVIVSRLNWQMVLSVFFYLSCKLGWSKATRIRWQRIGRVASASAVPNPRTEAERKCKRRVEIVPDAPSSCSLGLDASQWFPRP
jgi:hypothetical protein